MADGVSVTVIGDERLRSTMRGAARDIAETDLTPVAAKVARDASSRAPRVSGTLAGSIRPSYHGGNVSTVSSDVIYAGVQEYGWPTRNIRGKAFLRGALAAAKDDAVREAERQAQSALDDVKGA